VPIAATWSLRVAGVISSVWLSVPVAIALAAGAALAGSALWKRRRAPGDPWFSELLLWGWLRRLRAERQLADAVALVELAGAESELQRRRAAWQAKTRRLLTRLAWAVEARNPHLEGHSRRVARYAEMIARAMGLPSRQIGKIRAAAELHDVGQLRVPAEILDKPDPLARDEFELIQQHPAESAAMVACLRDPEITMMVRRHHERFDGTGYPAGLPAAYIPLGARIIAVADTFDAISAPRPHRVATPKKWALATLLNASGGQLDPAVVASFLRCYPRHRTTALWSLLAFSPQPLFAWLRGRRSAAADASLAGMLGVVALIAAMGSLAIGSPSGTARAQGRVEHAQPAIPRQAPPIPLPMKTSTHAHVTAQTQVLGAELVTRPHRRAAHRSRRSRAGRHRATRHTSTAGRYRSSSRRISSGGSPVRTGRGGSRVKHRFGSGRPRPGGSGGTGSGSTGVGGGVTGTSGGVSGGGTVGGPGDGPGDGPGGNPKGGPGGKPHDRPGGKPVGVYGD
jgi:hypothetical protein